MYADTVFNNGQVVTVDKKNTVCEAVAIKGNKILSVGSNEEVASYINDKTKVIDIKGKSLLPGFIDSHMHLAHYGLINSVIDCSVPRVESIEDLLKVLRNETEKKEPGQWIYAYGLRDILLAEQRLPTIEELDSVSKIHPIIIILSNGHNSVLNSKGLETVGIDENTVNPVGGEIQRDKNGRLTGRLIENAHFRVRSMVRPNDEEFMEGLSQVSDELLSMGITTLHDAGRYGPEDLRGLQEASYSGIVKTRISAMVLSMYEPHKFIDTMINAGIMPGLGNERFRIGPAKVFIDGSGSGPAVATREPYTHDPNNYGILQYTQEELNEILGTAHAKGFQITAHAPGDKAIDMMLNCIEEALEKHPRVDHRHRIEHASLAQPDQIERMKKLGVIVSPNPNFYYLNGDIYPTYYGDRIWHPNRDFFDAGLIVASGSDMPAMKDYRSPMFGIWGAVTRITKSGKIYGENQRISLEEAIRSYTWNGAYATFEEDIKGSIEAGKLADLVVLEDQILNVPEERLRDLQVELTMIDGEIVYQKEMVNN